MVLLQLSHCKPSHGSPFSINHSSPHNHTQCALSFLSWGGDLGLFHKIFIVRTSGKCSFDRRIIRKGVFANSGTETGFSSKLNLSEYMVTLEKPLGIRFALSVDGKIFVHALKKGGNAERSRMIMVGDTLKKASTLSGDGFIEIKDFGDTQRMLKEKNGSLSLILERPFSPFPIQRLDLAGSFEILFNRGKVPIATWNKNILASNLQPPAEGKGNTGFIVFSPKFLRPEGWDFLSGDSQMQKGMNGRKFHVKPLLPRLVGIFSEEEPGEVEWTYGSFPVEEYMKALQRSEGELYYNHDLGIHYSKITEHIYVGSCVQTEADVHTLSNVTGITAILNFQSESERANWGINSKSINDACRRSNILMVNYPIREADSIDLRKKLPFCVGLLLRLLRKNHQVFVTCTTGIDRSPACVIAYLHWIQDTALHEAYGFVTGLHSCKPDRPAIVWATWDLIATVENGKHNGPPTHAVNFIWNGREGEEVCLIGDFTGNWKESVKAVYKGGSKYEVELRLPQGKYYYKFIVGGQWRHSTSLPTETDQGGNMNNVIRVGDIASIRPSTSASQHMKDPTIMKVIERSLTEDERFLLAFAARLMAFRICPIRLSPK